MYQCVCVCGTTYNDYTYYKSITYTCISNIFNFPSSVPKQCQSSLLAQRGWKK